MEVHHHPQVEKKNFKEYFLEFLMIFLAVTLGFFAENIRESRVNKEKEEHYIQNLIADLRADSVNLKLTMADQDRENHMLDSALKIPAERLADIKVQDTFFHYIFLYYSYVPDFNQSTNTISQLKAGGFNIMHNQATIDSINYIYQLYGVVEFDNKYNETNYWDVAHKAQSIMRLPEPAVSPHDPSVNIIPNNRRIFLTNDAIAIAQLYNVLGNSIGSFKTTLNAEKGALAKVVKLIAYLRKQYDIE
ncbi:MAG TPA: hypothetical protein VG367_07505 [Mucilaginibacter sp.]|jgi:hypothetical protein|nr:hypothetical protein [Mucilaginibacter sp.]